KKLALLDLLKRGQGLAPSGAPPIPRIETNEPAPLSFAQERLWLLHHLDPESPAYNDHFAIRLKGTLNKTALEKSLNEIIKRHEALRTTFDVRQGRAIQIVLPSLRLGISIADLRGFPEQERLPIATRMAVEDARRPFDLANGPLLRASLLHL